MNTKLLLTAIATLLGTVVGAGVLAIPYTVARSGFLIGGLEILLLCFIVTLFFLYFGEICLRTKEKHELAGYANKYLGKFGKYLMTFAMVVSIYGALSAYTIGVGAALGALFSGSALYFGLGFFVIFSFFIFMGLKLIKKIDFYMMFFIMFVILIVCIFSFDNINTSNLTTINWAKLFLPYGVIMFAFSGLSVIPEVKEVLTQNKKLMKRTIITGFLVILTMYLLFTLFVVGISGLDTTEVATVGLGKLLGTKILIFGSLFAALCMSTSFLNLGLALRWMYQYDYKLNKYLSTTLVCIVPLIIFLSSLTSFVNAIGLAGIIGGSIEGTLVVLMHRKAKKKGDRKPEYKIKSNLAIYIILLAVFLIGILASLLTYFNIL